MQAPGQFQRSCREGSEGSGEGLGGFGAEPGQVQQGSAGFRRRFRRRFQEALGLGAKPSPEKVLVKVWEALVQSQVRFNRVPEKVPEKVWQALV